MTEEYETEGFDPIAEAARIEAEEEAKAAASPAPSPRPAAGGIEGVPPAAADDWEPIP